MKTIGVVVLNYNKYELTQKCVDNLLNLGCPVQILIVDNRSTNDSFQILKKRYINEKNVDTINNSENGGYAKGNNFGMNYFLNNYDDIKYYCVMNPDVEIVYPEIFNNLKEILDNNPRMAMATGKIVTNGKQNFDKCFWDYPRKREAALGHSLAYKKKKGSIHYIEKDIGEVETIPGSFFMIKREVFEKLNGFDEGTFLYNEENIMGIRLSRIGLVSGLSTNDYFNHNHPKGPRKTLIQKIRSRKIGNQSRRYMCKTYYKKIDSILLELVIAFNYCYIISTHLLGNILRLKNRKGQ